MAAGTLNLIIEQGSTFSKVLTYKDSSGTVIDLSGYSARMQARVNVGDTYTLFSLTSASGGGLTISGVDGKITITITSTATATYKFDTAVYDLEIDDGSGVVTRLIEGKITLSKEVTR